MNIEISARVDVTTPSSGFNNVFFDSDNSNALTYKDALGVFHVISSDPCCGCDDDCACDVTKDMIKNFECLASKGVLTGAEYITLIQGLNLVITTVCDPITFTKTTTVTNTPTP